jgi:hypothetical protein
MPSRLGFPTRISTICELAHYRLDARSLSFEHMKFERFELSVIELAGQGVQLSVPNVSAYLRVAPSKTEEWLDKMAYEGRLDVELEEDQGYVYYRVRGLTPFPGGSHTPMPSAMVVRPELLPMRGQKSATWGAIFGLLIPGFGLFYAAPITAAILGGVALAVLVNVAGAFPLLGPLFAAMTLALGALTSAILGAEYTKRYNAFGCRTHLERDELKEHAKRWPVSAVSALESAVRR